ncbi:MAG TPA: flagellar biosynthetic protein FliR [Casimicrobiaceae bacterium]|nr:flagellar biosynthetic protein FliR [Casimicrobiaceae bacterium]
MLTFTPAEIDAWLAAFLYPFVRVLALMSAAPLFSHASVPFPVRIGLALVITLVIAPTLPAAPFVSPFSALGVIEVVTQVLIGVAIGLTMQIVFAAVELAGDLIGLQMGLSFAGFIDPENAEQSPLIGSFLSIGLMLLFLSLNGHLALVAALRGSFDSLPIAATAWRGIDSARLVATASGMFATGLSLALPIVGALLVVNLALGVLSRTAPQLNLFAVGFPLTLLVGLLMLLLAAPFAMPALTSVLEQGLSILPR